MDSKPVCVITGASRGIGLATALRFAGSGYDIVAAARGAAALEQAVRQMSAAGAACEGLPVDVSRPEGAAELIDVARSRFHRVDVLVNNAGVAPLAPIDQLSDQAFQDAIAVNIGGVFYTTRAAWPLMRDRKAGTIVNISSVASIDPFPGFAVYGACKAWVNLFTQAIAAEGKPLGIRAFSVAPGAVETDLLRGSFPDYPGDQTLQPAAVAAAVRAVCEADLKHATGQTIFIRP